MTKVFAPGRIAPIAQLVAISLLQAGLAIAGAFCVQQVFDRMLGQESQTSLAHMFAIAALFIASIGAIVALEVRRLVTAERFSLGYIAELRAAMFERIMRAAPHAIHKRRESGLLLPFVGDLTAIKKWVGDGLARAISASVTLLILLGALYWIAAPLAVAAAIVVAVAIALGFLMSHALMKAIRRVRNRRGALANFVSSSARAVATVQAFNRIDRERERLERRTEALTEAGVRLARLSGVMSALAIGAGGALVVITLGSGVIGAAGGALSAGVLAGAISLVGLASTAIRDLGMAFELGKRAQASFAKVKSALAIEASISTDRRRQRTVVGEGVVALEHVVVNPVLRGVTLTAKPGEIVNIEGASGAGKSLLASLIVRLRDPDQGVVSLDGVDVRRVSPRSLRQNVGFAGDAAPLMRGTVLMNLKYRVPRASGEQLAQSIEACGLKDFIDGLSAREQTRLSEGAPELARGDQQRLMIARAVLGAPRVLVLDEVDSHLSEEAAASLASFFAAYPGVVIMSALSPSWRAIATTTWRIADNTVTATPRTDKANGALSLRSAS